MPAIRQIRTSSAVALWLMDTDHPVRRGVGRPSQHQAAEQIGGSASGGISHVVKGTGGLLLMAHEAGPRSPFTRV
jgi:hypothetical protein